MRRRRGIMYPNSATPRPPRRRKPPTVSPVCEPVLPVPGVVMAWTPLPPGVVMPWTPLPPVVGEHGLFATLGRGGGDVGVTPVRGYPLVGTGGCRVERAAGRLAARQRLGRRGVVSTRIRTRSRQAGGVAREQVEGDGPGRADAARHGGAVAQRHRHLTRTVGGGGDGRPALRGGHCLIRAVAGGRLVRRAIGRRVGGDPVVDPNRVGREGRARRAADA